MYLGQKYFSDIHLNSIKSLNGKILATQVFFLCDRLIDLENETSFVLSK